jgi:hypothetical protein
MAKSANDAGKQIGTKLGHAVLKKRDIDETQNEQYRQYQRSAFTA